MSVRCPQSITSCLFFMGKAFSPGTVRFNTVYVMKNEYFISDLVITEMPLPFSVLPWIQNYSSHVHWFQTETPSWYRKYSTPPTALTGRCREKKKKIRSVFVAFLPKPCCCRCPSDAWVWVDLSGFEIFPTPPQRPLRNGAVHTSGARS